MFDFNFSQVYQSVLWKDTWWVIFDNIYNVLAYNNRIGCWLIFSDSCLEAADWKES